MMSVQFAFSDDADSAIRKSVIDELRKKGVGEAEALFPGAENAALGKLFTVRAAPDADENELVQMLNDHSAVEYAEIAPRRRLAKEE